MRKLNTMLVLLMVATASFAVTIDKATMSDFKPGQARVLNKMLGQAETAINANTAAGALVFPTVIDTNVTTVVTTHTPAGIGQLLVGGAGAGTNAAWVSTGTTTNGWTKISSFAP
jgi:ABC-type uncharacterized transport system involved in gliding motility auxiliary subunit